MGLVTFIKLMKLEAFECVLRDDDAIAHHKTLAHYKGWADFKAAGGVESQTVMKLESASIAPWALQP